MSSILTIEERAEALEYANKVTNSSHTEETLKEQLAENYLINALVEKRKVEAAEKAGNSFLEDVKKRSEAHSH